MRPSDPNLGLVGDVARALGGLCDRFVFLGGCATGLLITDHARPPVRVTRDVDIIVELASIVDYYKLQDELRDAGFREHDATICRWRVADIDVDVMPTNEEILGFSNRWYRLALETAHTIELPDHQKIRLVSPPLFVATKLEAFFGRGEGRFNDSRDIEDIVNVIDGRPEIVDEIRESSVEVRSYLQDEIETFLGIPEFLDALPWHFNGEPANQSRTTLVIERLRRIAGV